MYYYQDNYAWNVVYSRYTYGYSWTTYTYSSMSTGRYFSNGPIELAMVRDRSNQRWGMWSRAVGDGELTFSNNMYSQYIYDSWLSRWYNYAGWSYANMRVGLFAENQQSYAIKTAFDFFARGPYTQWAATQTYATFWAQRNSTLATLGACAISRSLTRIVVAPSTDSTIQGLMGGDKYTVKIRSEGPSGVSSWVDIGWTPTATTSQPSIAPVPALFLDAATLRPQARLATWADQSPNNRDFKANSLTTAPSVTKAAGETASVTFSGTSQFLWNPSTTVRKRVVVRSVRLSLVKETLAPAVVHPLFRITLVFPDACAWMSVL